MKSIRLVMILGALLMLAACGGGGGGGSVAATNTVSGVASAGIVSGGTVKVYDAATYGTATKKQLGTTAVTGADGKYSVNVGSFAGPVVVEITGGTYVDEATATSTPLSAPLRAAVSVTGNVQVAVTPLTELAVRKAAAADPALGASAIASANALVTDLFKVDVIAVAPLDAGKSIVGENADQQAYTMALAAVSQYGKGQTLDAALTAINNGIVNNQMSAAVAASLTSALADFVKPENAAINKTGITSATIPAALNDLGSSTLKVAVALPVANVGLVDATITVPAGVSAAASNGVLTSGAYLLPAGSTIKNVQGTFSAGTLHLLLPSAEAALPVGDIAVLVFKVAPGTAVPAATAFTVTDATALFAYNGGAPVAGAITLH